MVKLNKIYTKTGDKGTTALGNGERRVKYDLRIRSYGLVDSLNATLGLVRLHTERERDIDNLLAIIQNDLFDLGADLCIPIGETEAPDACLRLTQNQIDRLETQIDHFNAALSPLSSFILPGGTALAAHLHIARTKTREAEQLIAELMDKEGEAVNPFDLVYLNRLSDLFFVLARYANHQGQSDVLWRPGASR